MLHVSRQSQLNKNKEQLINKRISKIENDIEQLSNRMSSAEDSIFVLMMGNIGMSDTIK